MSHHIFHSQDDFNQASINNVARLFFDHATHAMADGHKCTYVIDFLNQLSTIAFQNQCHSSVVATYTDMLVTAHDGVEFTDDMKDGDYYA